MKQAILWIIVIVGLVAVVLYGLSSLNESAANKAYAQGQARAMIIEAQGQSRLDSAQAAAITASANIPYVVLALALASMFGSACLVVAIIAIQRQSSQTRIERIETRTVFVLGVGSRRDLWRQLSDNAKLLGGGDRD